MDEELRKRLKAALEEERESLRRQLQDMGVDPDASGIEGLEFDAGFSDSASSTAERARLLGLTQRLRTSLKDVEDALRRMEEGKYGVCQSCGREIELERLEAIPQTKLCVACARAATRK